MAKPKAIECPVCGVCRLHPGDFFESSLRRVRWGQCLCSDENVCIGHTVSDEAMPERPPDAVLIERARVQHAEKIKRWEAEAARFAEHVSLRAEVERLREAARQVHALAEKALGEYWTVGIAAQTFREIHKITKGMVE